MLQAGLRYSFSESRREGTSSEAAGLCLTQVFLTPTRSDNNRLLSVGTVQKVMTNFY